MLGQLEKAKEIHDILQEYIKIHNDIFKSSLRRIIPFFGIFEAIDYGKHYKNLNSLKERLNGIIRTLDKESEFGALIKQYAEALLDTILCLGIMCEKLYEKSQGNLKAYTWQQYRKDLTVYKASANKYAAFGLQVNEYLYKPEYVQPQQKFMTKQDVMITSAEVIKLLVTGIANIPASELLSECNKIGMRQVPYQDVGGIDSILPPFDAGYHLRFNPDGKEEALFEILEKDGFVLQAGYQLGLPKAQNRYQQLKQIIESHYGGGYPMDVGEIEIINYGNENTVAYLSHTKIAGNDVITIRVGNRRFWG